MLRRPQQRQRWQPKEYKMRRENNGIGFAAMKKEHSEKKYDCLDTSNRKYAQSDVDNEPELKRSADALSSYVKKNKMNY